MEASALASASRRGLLGRRSPVLKLSTDERLVELIRADHDRAFEVLFDRYQARLFAFCRHMLPSDQDAEDVLQDVFVSAHRAMTADERHLNVRPWLYRIARNRCLNHLRKRTADGQDSMDEHVHMNGTSTAEHVQNREELRELLREVKTLPETQRTALLLREVDALSYSEIAESMDTTVPAVKSLLVRARVTLAEASQARLLTCGEVRLQLAEAAEGLRKVEGPVRHHVRRCDECIDFRDQLQSNSRSLAALFPIGPLAAMKGLLLAKLGIGASSGGGAATSGAASGGLAGGGAAAGGGSAAVASGAAAGGGAISTAIGGVASGGAGIGGMITGALGAKAAAGVATAALLTAGAVEVKHYVQGGQREAPAVQERIAATEPAGTTGGTRAAVVEEPTIAPEVQQRAADVSPEEEPAVVEAVAPAEEPVNPTTPVVAVETPEEPVVPPADTAPADAPVVEDPGPITIDPGHGSSSTTSPPGGTAIVGPGTTTAPPPTTSDPSTQAPPPAPDTGDEGDDPPAPPEGSEPDPAA